eukprot:gnl/MRDRNA2_/MRDRNA2_89045_c0_seq1.p1 gnl/MRDRNA2_/MRDRNA2_89045_c0~~gnl/MRDRNA2_/MRDRNA2_89045_c0_seq1.p1  ORF type:complete len:277 (+),score=85.39 gnl/MRDRNA2_/MRDRNA2_89045_c0_seq1:87-917(+)
MMYQEEESIYNIIPPKKIEAEKPPMYRSTHSGKIPPTASTFGQAGTSHPMSTNIAGDSKEKVVTDKVGRTFGKHPGSYQPDPQGFLKVGDKNTKVASLADVKKDQPHLLQPSVLKTKNKPSIPKKDDTPIMNLVSSKNFVVANAVETILAAPKKSAQASKDYLHKEDYGKVPKYLEHIKNDIDAEYEYIQHLQQQQMEAAQSSSRLLTDDEKFGMIQGLKAKWEAVNTDYQATTHLTKLDTIGKVRRKEKYEAELTQIEKDIEKLNRKHIYVDAHS